MKTCEDIIKFILFRKLFKLKDLKDIKENDLAYLSIKLSSRKIKFEIDVVVIPDILPEEEIKKFIARTNPYITKENQIRKYRKKANLMFLLKEKFSEIYDQMIKPSYYLVFDEKTNSFVKGEDIPEWYKTQFLKDRDESLSKEKPLICWSENDAQNILKFMADPFENMGIKHSYVIRAYNADNDLLEFKE